MQRNKIEGNTTDKCYEIIIRNRKRERYSFPISGSRWPLRADIPHQFNTTEQFWHGGQSYLEILLGKSSLISSPSHKNSAAVNMPQVWWVKWERKYEPCFFLSSLTVEWAALHVRNKSLKLGTEIKQSWQFQSHHPGGKDSRSLPPDLWKGLTSRC